MHATLRRLVGLFGFAVGVALVPRWLAAREAGDFYRGDVAKQEAMARAVDHWVDNGVVARTFATGSPRFDSEWIFGTYQMAALGFGQMALEHPETRAENRVRMERAIDRMLERGTRAFDTDAWGHDALNALDGKEGHAAFLGYTNLVLSLHRVLYPDSKYASLGDRLTAALSRRLDKSPSLLLETYPLEVFPVDNTAVVASIALHARATGRAMPPIVARFSEALRAHYIDRMSGLLHQAAGSDGAPIDAPRGSGTALASYFLSFCDPVLSFDLHAAIERELANDVFGFRVVSEYPSHVPRGHGDIDSGPLVFGLSVSATGFSIAGCRIHGDERCYTRTLAAADLIGAPTDRTMGRTYVSGGPLGDAILFAMETAQRRPS